mmetsp:Transcript_23953/g.59461  ORF Transcript_23953/g.59461 Transcript_23953/m.59461 type:complete len:266 (+) Transcript_23953:941-1738(+)
MASTCLNPASPSRQRAALRPCPSSLVAPLRTSPHSARHAEAIAPGTISSVLRSSLDSRRQRRTLSQPCTLMKRPGRTRVRRGSGSLPSSTRVLTLGQTARRGVPCGGRRPSTGRARTGTDGRTCRVGRTEHQRHTTPWNSHSSSTCCARRQNSGLRTAACTTLRPARPRSRSRRLWFALGQRWQHEAIRTCRANWRGPRSEAMDRLCSSKAAAGRPPALIRRSTSWTPSVPSLTRSSRGRRARRARGARCSRLRSPPAWSKCNDR